MMQIRHVEPKASAVQESLPTAHLPAGKGRDCAFGPGCFRGREAPFRGPLLVLGAPP